jgi:ubiquinone/menaquinone biosynthesis C-methylase UbiE
MAKQDKFPSYYGPDWDRKITDSEDPNFWKYGVANLVFLDYFGDKKMLLDAGCGTGDSTLFLAKNGRAEQIVGIDVVESMIKVARAKALEKRLNQKVCFVVCDGRFLPFKNSCFDAVISRGDAFCFLIPMKRAVREFRRVLSSKGAVAVEIDNMRDWKRGTVVSTGFKKMRNGTVAYLMEIFDINRNHYTKSYVLNPECRIVQQVLNNPEFAEKGFRKWEYPLKEIKREAVEIRKGVKTHWPIIKELRNLFEKNGYGQVTVVGDGLLMKLLLNGNRSITEAMKREPDLFFRIEKALIPIVEINAAPTFIMKATKIDQ